MRKKSVEDRTKRRIAGTARRLAGVRDEVQQIADEIPEPPESVLEHRAPWTVDAERKGVLESVAHDLTDAVRSLERLTDLTPGTI